MTKKKLKRLLLCTFALMIVLSFQGIFSFAESYGGERLYHFGLISGSGSGEMVLNEEKYFTREQLALIILEINGLKEEAIQKNLSPRYNDLEQIGKWARPFVAYCQEKKLMSGSNGMFNPKGIVTGKELGAVILRALGYQTAWNDVESKLDELGIPSYSYKLYRRDAFEYIWKAITLPVTPDGKSLAVKLGKVKPEDIVIRFEKGTHYGLKDGNGKIVLKAEYDYISADFTYGIGYTIRDQKFSVINIKGEVIHPSFSNLFRFSDGMAGYEKDKKYGFIDKDGNLIIEPVYENIYFFAEGVTWVQKDNKWILIDKQGHVLNDTGYDWIDPFSDGQAIVQKDSKCFLIDKEGNTLANVEGEYDWGYYNGDGLYLATKENGTSSLIDRKGKIIAKYDLISEYDENLFEITKNEKHGLIDKQGNMIIAPVYDRIEFFSDDFFLVVKGEKSGLIDKQGKILTEPIYDWINFFSDDRSLLLVSKNEKLGLIDKQGKVVIEPIYDWINFFSDDRSLLLVSKNEKRGLFDIQGNQIIETAYTHIQSISDPLIVIQDGGQYGVVNKDGKTVISSVYDWMHFLPDGNISAFHKNWATKQSKLITMDRDGKIISEKEIPYDSMIELTENSVLVSKDNKYGIADKNGEVIVELLYDGYGFYSKHYVALEKDGKTTLFDENLKSIAEINDIYNRGFEFAEDFIQVIKDNHRGLIGKQGKIIAEPIYDWIGFFSDDLFLVTKGEKRGLVDKQGKIIAEPIYDQVEFFSDDLFLVSKGEKRGLVDKQGKIIAKPIYDEISGYDDNNGTTVVVKDGKYGLIDLQGKLILDTEFDYINNYHGIRAEKDGKQNYYNKFGTLLFNN